MDLATVESLGISDPGKWMAFCVELDMVYAIKLTSEDEDDILCNCTTIYCVDGDTYIIDTNYHDFKKIFLEYKNQ